MIGRAEGIIDHERQTVLVREDREGVDIRDVAVGVAEGLDVDGFCVLLNGCANLIQIEYINKCGADAVLWKGVCQQVVGDRKSTRLNSSHSTSSRMPSSA